MKKFICLAILVVLLAPMGIYAQTVHQPWRHQFDIEGGLKVPMGELKDNLMMNTGQGFGLTYYLQILSDRHFFFSAGVGYDWFSSDLGSAQLSEKTTIDIIPLNLGVRYNFKLTGIQPYVGLELGMWRFHVNSGNTASGVSTESTTFAFTPIPKVGVRFPIAPQIDFDANIKYGISFYKADNMVNSESYQQLEINIGVAYTLGSDNYNPM